MKESIRSLLLCAAALFVFGLPSARAADQPTARGSREEAILVSIEASVQSVDRPKREVTVKGPLGNTATFTAGPQVKRFEEIAVGDLIRADYYISVATELRKPTRDEEKAPIQFLEAAGKASSGAAPAAGGARLLKVVTTVEGLDRPTKTVTVKGPGGNYFTARAADVSNLEKLRIGDKIVVTLTEAVAVSLEKVGAKRPE